MHQARVAGDTDEFSPANSKLAVRTFFPEDSRQHDEIRHGQKRDDVLRPYAIAEAIRRLRVRQTVFRDEDAHALICEATFQIDLLLGVGSLDAFSFISRQRWFWVQSRRKVLIALD